MQALQKNVLTNAKSTFENMLKNNADFARFMQSVKGQTPEEVAKQYGIDLDGIKKMIK
jgi:hypothetical protein